MRGRKISGLSAEWVSFLESKGGLAAFARKHRTGTAVVRKFARGETVRASTALRLAAIEGLPASVRINFDMDEGAVIQETDA